MRAAGLASHDIHIIMPLHPKGGPFLAMECRCLRGEKRNSLSLGSTWMCSSEAFPEDKTITPKIQDARAMAAGQLPEGVWERHDRPKEESGLGTEVVAIRRDQWKESVGARGT
jgi:hypothetical protein